jgi:hypothetical protein
MREQESTIPIGEREARGEKKAEQRKKKIERCASDGRGMVPRRKNARRPLPKLMRDGPPLSLFSFSLRPGEAKGSLGFQARSEKGRLHGRADWEEAREGEASRGARLAARARWRPLTSLCYSLYGAHLGPVCPFPFPIHDPNSLECGHNDHAKR